MVVDRTIQLTSPIDSLRLSNEGLKPGMSRPVPGDLQIYLQSSGLTVPKHTYSAPDNLN